MLLRKIRKQQEASNTPPSMLPRLFAAIAVLTLAFCVTQLVMVAVLEPKSRSLSLFTEEREALVEQNRILESEIAAKNSLERVRILAENDLGMKSAEQIDSIEVTHYQASAE